MNLSEVGHVGTLDPLATGLLILLVGRATKLSHMFLSQDKGYFVKVRFGVKTDTGDLLGNIEDYDSVCLNPSKMQKQALLLQGEIHLPVPIYSAVKVKGKKLYEMARRKEKITSPKKLMHFYDVNIREKGPNWLSVSLFCRKGGYIRSWAEALGQNLGTVACVEELQRFYSAPFRLEEALSLEDLEDSVFRGGFPFRGWKSMDELLKDWPQFYVKGKDETMILNGQISRSLGAELIRLQKQVNLMKKSENVRVFGLERGRTLSLLELRPFTPPQIRCVFPERKG